MTKQIFSTNKQVFSTNKQATQKKEKKMAMLKFTIPDAPQEEEK